MNKSLVNHISELISDPIINVNYVAGGDISIAYKLETNTNLYFLKCNNTPQAYEMFEAEALGLLTISSTNAIATPQVITLGRYQKTSFLILEFIESKTPNIEDYELLGAQLAALHGKKAIDFGFEMDNFIGSLNQSNKQHTNWSDFYAEERLLPQLNLAKAKGLLSSDDIPTSQILKDKLIEYFKNIEPSLIHGDLWSGNYLISKESKPYLIDPAVYYGDPLVDIAMSKLFGGFGDSFYKSYFEVFAEDDFTKTRIEIYQLYYLLVHLNLFGNSYYGSVKSILEKYF